MNAYTGKTALITRASSGIGGAFAQPLAFQGAHLILVARSEDKRHAVATILASQHSIGAHVITVDLSHPDAGKCSSPLPSNSACPSTS